ncbi:MAG: TonB family protein, partial [Goleter apudmare HA4340-LM2]|nr:TonB family protein [Goleter apudmare HA4340-LM2]
PKIASAPTESQPTPTPTEPKIASAPTESQPTPTPTEPKIASAPTESQPTPTPTEPKIASAPTKTQPAPTPTEPKIASAPTESQPAPTRTDVLPQRNRVAAAKTPGLLKTPSSPQPPLKSGAASRLGGPISLSSRDFKDNYAAALPNSSRDNPNVNGVDARQDTNLGPYLKELQRKVKQQWLPTLTQSSRRSVLHFTIQRSGQVSNLQISQSSGFIVTDEAALSAVKRAAPFLPLPATYRENNIQIEFTFSINVYGELDIWGGG